MELAIFLPGKKERKKSVLCGAACWKFKERKVWKFF